MSAVAAAQYARLAGDAALVSALGTYQAAPCIFLEAATVPALAPRPYLWSPGPVADVPWDTKGSRGREITTDVWCVTDATASPRLVGDIAEMVRALFHRRDLDVAGYATVLATCTGPVVGESDATLRARVLTTKWTLRLL